VTDLPKGEFRSPLISYVFFGAGSVKRLKEKVEELGALRILVITGPSIAGATDLVERVKTALGKSFAGVFSGVLQHVPRKCVIEGARVAREAKADLLLSLGGSSTADAAKGINLVLTESEKIEDFFATYGRADATVSPQFHKPKLPQIAIPTTLSGGEFTGSVGITDTERMHKDVYRSPELTPKVVILDPEMTLSTPRELWTSTGLKVLSDCFEEICSARHQPFVDALALHAIRLIHQYLPSSASEPINMDARGFLQHAAWMSLYGLAATGLGIVAALRHQIGPMYDIPHGIVSTIIFPAALSFNRPQIDQRLGLTAKAMDLAIAGTRDVASAAINKVKELRVEFGLPTRLRDVAVPRSSLRRLAAASLQDYQIRNNPKPVETAEQLMEVLEDAW